MNTKRTFIPTTKRGVDTYQKVIDAGINCIASEGFHFSSTNKIAKKAGVTWGTLQHQFGDKARLLEAILENCVNSLIEQLLNSTQANAAIEERINSLVEAIWHNLQTSRGQAMHAILEGVQSDRVLRERFQPILQKLRNSYNELWHQLFSDRRIDEARMEAIKQLTFSTLRGLACDMAVRSSGVAIIQAKELLKDNLSQLLLTATTSFNETLLEKPPSNA